MLLKDLERNPEIVIMPVAKLYTCGLVAEKQLHYERWLFVGSFLLFRRVCLFAGRKER